MIMENKYQIINRHFNKKWYYTIRIINSKNKVRIGKIEKSLAIKLEKENSIS